MFSAVVFHHLRTSSLVNMPHFKLNCSFSCRFGFLSTLYILDSNSDIYIYIYIAGNYFFPFLRLLLCLSDDIICCIETFEFHEAHLLIFGLIHFIRVLYKMCFLMPMSLTLYLLSILSYSDY